MSYWTDAYNPGPVRDQLTKLGPYQIERVLGQGAVAVVYRARWAGQQVVALKVLNREAAGHANVRRAFLSEHRLLTRLHHPGIVRVVDGGEIEGRLFYAMDLVEGETLDALLTRTKLLGETAAIGIARQVADALDYLHQRGIVHRDLKPANILLTPQGRALLFDFGTAVDMAESATADGQGIYGTPGYVSPEQAAGQQLDGRSDLYSLGVVLYRMITGRKPFYGSRSEMLEAHMRAEPPPPSEFTYVSPDLERIILKALAKAPAARFQSGAELVAALDQAHLAPPPEPTELPQRILSWLRGKVVAAP